MGLMLKDKGNFIIYWNCACLYILSAIDIDDFFTLCHIFNYREEMVATMGLRVNVYVYLSPLRSSFQNRIRWIRDID